MACWLFCLCLCFSWYYTAILFYDVHYDIMYDIYLKHKDADSIYLLLANLGDSQGDPTRLK